MLSLRRLIPLSIVTCVALAAPISILPSPAVAQAVVSITVAPPVLPVYAQPVIPGPGYLWAPGYWAWGPDGYYWVPGTWVQPPEVGLLWTPGFWGWGDGVYLWHVGYWGPHIGFYGGINYGFGYTGSGYAGGHWDHGQFFYNRAVNNFGGAHLTNVYNDPVHVTNVTRVAFNGGRGGTTARPSPQEQAAAQEHHTDATPLQSRHEHAAAGNHALLASVNHGRPPVAATAHPASFTGRDVIGPRGVPHANGAHPPQAAHAQHAPVRPAAAHPPAARPAHPAPAHPAPVHPAEEHEEHH